MPIRDALLPLFSSRTLGHVGSLATLFGVYSLLAVWKEYSTFKDVGDVPSDLHAAFSVVVGWLLVFRTNTAYNRWWEARSLWGGLVNASRNMALKLSRLARIPTADLAETQHLLQAFPYALKDHLRNEENSELMTGFNINSDSKHMPSFIAARLYEKVSHWKSIGVIDGDEMRVIDSDLSKYMDICGACEKILKTPIVRSYRHFTRQCVLLLLLTFPWGIVSDFLWWTIPMTIITAYFMLGLETVAEHVEEPFGRDDDDLDLDSLCATIEKSVGEIIKPKLQA